MSEALVSMAVMLVPAVSSLSCRWLWCRCRIGGIGVDAFVSGAGVSGSAVLGYLVWMSTMVEYMVSRGMSCWWLL